METKRGRVKGRVGQAVFMMTTSRRFSDDFIAKVTAVWERELIKILWLQLTVCPGAGSVLDCWA